MMDKKNPHIHKFKKLRYKSGNEIFFCALPDCDKKINPVLALGKRSLCWRCGQEFILTEYSLRLMKPHCDNCHKPKKSDGKDFVLNDDGSREFIGTETLSLADRLSQTIQNAQQTEEQEDEI